MQLLILEDNEDRRRQMQACLDGRFPQLAVRFHVSAGDMLEALGLINLDDVALISLDHDLELLPTDDGKLIDPGDGRDVAGYLAQQPPSCPVVIHTTNTHAGDTMQAMLDEAGWTTSRVVPYGDLEWIPQIWIRAVRNTIDGGRIQSATVEHNSPPGGRSNTLPWRFPDERDRIHEEAQRFRQLSSSERFERVLDLVAFGRSFLETSPNRDAARRLREQDEKEWRRRFRELFAQYESGS